MKLRPPIGVLLQRMSGDTTQSCLHIDKGLDLSIVGKIVHLSKTGLRLSRRPLNILFHIYHCRKEAL